MTFDMIPGRYGKPHTRMQAAKIHEPTEAEHQCAVIDWCRLKAIPIFHIPNGGSRNTIEATNLRRQGVKPGVPDLCVPLVRGGYHGLYIEMKRNTKSRTTTEQFYWKNLLSDEGYLALICYGADEAITQIDRYVGLQREDTLLE